MTEQEALEFFDHLPLDDRLRLVRDILSDIEGRISRARAELNGESPQLVLPELEGQTPEPIARPGPAKASMGDSLPPPVEDETVKVPDDFADFDLTELTGGQSHTINRLRLMDAAAHYEKLLKKYGFVPAFEAIGYRETAACLRSEISPAQAEGLMNKNTWAYAKRQITWFKRDAEIEWVRNAGQALRLARAFLKSE